MKKMAMEQLNKTSDYYARIENPKYRHANLEELKEHLEDLHEYHDDLKDMKQYTDLINGIYQIIKRIEGLNGESVWRNSSERGINKTIRPVVGKPGHPIVFPYEWKDPETGSSCSINGGTWDAKCFMAMDILGYMFLLKEGGDLLPKNPAYIFNDIKSIESRETELSQITNTNAQITIDELRQSKHWIRFTDAEFRRFFGGDISSNQILELLHNISKVEFKLVFPVRMPVGKKMKEKTYNMNVYSRLFELATIDIDTRKDGIVKSRAYEIYFTTILGELFIHNLLAKNYDWIDNRFYRLPYNAQIFYRLCILHHDYKSFPISAETIRERLNLSDKNMTCLIKTIEENILGPLKKYGFIDSYEKENGLKGIVYRIHRPGKGKLRDVK